MMTYRMERRALLLGGVAATALSHGAFAQTPRPLLVMLTFKGCDGCIKWENAIGRAWKRTQQFTRLDFVEIETENWNEVSNPAAWPSQFRRYAWVFEAFVRDKERWMRDDERLQGRPTTLNTAPRFILVVGDEIKSVGVGQRAWESYLKKDIDHYAGV